MNLFRFNSMVHLFVLCFPFACLLFMTSMFFPHDEYILKILMRFGLLAIPLFLGCFSFFGKSQIASFMLLFMWVAVSIAVVSEACERFKMYREPIGYDFIYFYLCFAVVLPIYGFVSTYAWLRWIWISSLTRGEPKSGGILTG